MTAITKQTFENIKNKSFEITLQADNTISCELLEVKSIACHTLKEGQAEPFSLLFQIAGDTIYEQNTYVIKNNELEEMPLFLVPIGADEKGVRYEAVFT